MIAHDRPALTLADLDRHDPAPTGQGAARRALFLRLLDTCPTLDAFLDQAAGALPVVPLCTRLAAGGCDAPSHNRRGPCDKAGKAPRVKWKPYQTGAVPTAADVAQWRRQWPTANWGLAAGPGSGVLLLDQDDNPAPLDLPPTVTVHTGRVEGRHYYFAYPDGARIKNLVGFRPGWDVRAQGGILILPGSLHPSGKRYALDRASLAHGIAALPAGLLATLVGPPPPPSRDADPLSPSRAPARAGWDLAAVLGGVPEGQRDDRLFQLAASLHRASVPEWAATELVRSAAARCQPPFDADQAAEKVERLYAAPPEEDQAREWVPRAALDQARAEIAELKATRRALLAEHAALKRQAPETFLPRLGREMLAASADKRVWQTLGVLLTIHTERAAHLAAGEPADTPIPWDVAARAQELGRSDEHIRKALNRLEEYAFIDREYPRLEPPGSGDHRRRLRVLPRAELPLDLADALHVVGRRLRDGPPPRVRPKRSQGCAPCRTAQCPTHPTAPVQKRVDIHCTECNAPAAPVHVHAPQVPTGRAALAIQHLRPAVCDFGAITPWDARPNFLVEPEAAPDSAVHGSPPGGLALPDDGGVRPKILAHSTSYEVRPKILVEPSPPAAEADAALTVAEQLAAGLELDTLPPSVGQPLKLRLYDLVPQLWPCGTAPPPDAPPPEDGCVYCQQPLAADELVCHARCHATAGVA